MHHVARMIDGDPMLVRNGVVAFLFVGAPSLATLASVDDQNRTSDAPKKLDRLRGIEMAAAQPCGAVDRISRSIYLCRFASFRRCAKSNACSGVKRGLVCCNCSAPAAMLVYSRKWLRPRSRSCRNPVLHSQRRIGKVHAHGTHSFDENKLGSIARETCQL